jgi:amidase
MSNGTLKSVDIMQACLDQIDQHDGYLRAVLSLAPGIMKIARALDEERRNNRTRSPLHGVPILIKVRSRAIVPLVLLKLFGHDYDGW